MKYNVHYKTSVRSGAPVYRLWIYLQGLETDEARNSETIDDVFFAWHRFPFPPTRRPVSSKSGTAFSSTGTKNRVCSTSFTFRARGQGCGSLFSQVDSSPLPFPVALRTRPSALPETTASARTLHVKTNPLTPISPKALNFKSWSGQRHQTANEPPPHRPSEEPLFKMAFIVPVSII